MSDYLVHREQYVEIEQVKSSMRCIDCGVRHRSVLGPRLFAIMTSDLPECTNTGNIEMFADETDAYCIGNTVNDVIGNLQKMLDDIALWCGKNSLSIHPDKTEIMIIHKKQFTGPLQPVWLHVKQIKFVDKSECLGITIHKDLNCELLIRKVCKTLIGKLKFSEFSKGLSTALNFQQSTRNPKNSWPLCSVSYALKQ